MQEIENNNTIDFEGKDFEKAQEVLKSTARVNTLINEESKIVKQKNEVFASTFKDDDSSDVIQEHLDKYTLEDLNEYLKGDIKEDSVQERIESFFTNEETGEVLTLEDNENVKNYTDELEFKRGMLLYFKQTDYYTQKIDEEVEKINKVTAELTEELNGALDPLKDNILAYAEFLEQKSEIEEGDSVEVIRDKKNKHKRALAIKNGYTLKNLCELIEKHPGLKENALKDFRNDDKVKAIGKRYSDKLKSADVGFNLYNLLSDDIHDSLEYRCLPLGEYPEGLENFTVFFIIRSMSMGLKTPEDIIFHASVQVSLNRLMDGSLDESVEERVKTSIIEFLNLFK